MPQPQTCPLVSTAKAVSNGMTLMGSEAIFTPAGKRTFTGLVKESRVRPSPSWPWLPTPHAYTRPSVSSAYSVEFEDATCATGPGSRIGAGDRIVFTGMIGRGPPENEPQCSTVRDGMMFRWVRSGALMGLAMAGMAVASNAAVTPPSSAAASRLVLCPWAGLRQAGGAAWAGSAWLLVIGCPPCGCHGWVAMPLRGAAPDPRARVI